MRGDADAATEVFASDGLFVAPTGTWRGHEAIGDAAAAFFAEAELVDVEVSRVVSRGPVGAIEWTWTERRKPDWRLAVIKDAIVHELADDGVRYRREYFDPAQTQPVHGAGTG